MEFDDLETMSNEIHKMQAVTYILDMLTTNSELINGDSEQAAMLSFLCKAARESYKMLRSLCKKEESGMAAKLEKDDDQIKETVKLIVSKEKNEKQNGAE